VKTIIQHAIDIDLVSRKPSDYLNHFTYPVIPLIASLSILLIGNMLWEWENRCSRKFLARPLWGKIRTIEWSEKYGDLIERLREKGL
jgi:hypothetical protein